MEINSKKSVDLWQNLPGSNAVDKANKSLKEKASNKDLKINVNSDDEVILSSNAQDMQKIKNIVKGIPDVREEKVKAVEQQIKNGTYQVDTGKLAEKILNRKTIDELV